MDIYKIRPYFLLGIIVGVIVLLFFILKPFLIPLSLAAMFAVVFNPVYQYLLQKMNGRSALAALVTVLVATVCAVVPLSFLVIRVVAEGQHILTLLSNGSGLEYLQTAFLYVGELFNRYLPSAGQFSATMASSIDSYAKDALSLIVSNVGGLFSSVAQILFSLLIFLISLFYLLRDGEQLRKTLVHLSPLADRDDDLVLNKLKLAVNSVVRGNFTVVLVQALLAVVGLSLFGVPNPVLWGMVAGLAAFIPGLGSSLVLLPAAGFLVITGDVWPAVGLVVWAVAVVGLIDNLLAPKLVGRGAQLHPLIVLLSVLGGLAFFGPAGLFLGPLSASLLFALLMIYLDSDI